MVDVLLTCRLLIAEPEPRGGGGGSASGGGSGSTTADASTPSAPTEFASEEEDYTPEFFAFEPAVVPSAPEHQDGFGSRGFYPAWCYFGGVVPVYYPKKSTKVLDVLGRKQKKHTDARLLRHYVTCIEHR